MNELPRIGGLQEGAWACFWPQFLCHADLRALSRSVNDLDQASAQILRYQYDANSRLTNRWSAVPQGGRPPTATTPSGISPINQGHQRTRQTRTDGSYASYTYDNIGQLKTAIGTGGHSTENLGYGYDAVWNLNTRTNMGTPTTFTVDVRNQLTGVGTATCSYDNNGNLT